MQAMFDLTDTQALVQASLTRWLADHAGFERRAGLLVTPEAITPLWRGLSQDLGLLGAALPEAVGGQGGGLADHALILQALGHALLPEPYLACAVLAGGLLQHLPGELPQQLLAGLVDGAVLPVLATLEPAARHDLAQVHSTLQLANPANPAKPADGGSPAATLLNGRKAVVRAAPYATHWLAVARACRTVGQGAVQLHGGMGMTDDLAIGHGFKRLTLIEGAGGGIAAQLRRVAAEADAG